jgi:hypothetical protein
MNTVVPVVVSVSLFCFSSVLAFDFAWEPADVEALMWVFVCLLPFSCLSVALCYIMAVSGISRPHWCF